jgi:uncharacterized membrane protein
MATLPKNGKCIKVKVLSEQTYVTLFLYIPCFMYLHRYNHSQQKIFHHSCEVSEGYFQIYHYIVHTHFHQAGTPPHCM